MTMTSDTATLLDREIDDLLLDIRGYALVRDMLVARGATAGEIESHSRALARTRARLAELIRGPGSRSSEARAAAEDPAVDDVRTAGRGTGGAAPEGQDDDAAADRDPVQDERGPGADDDVAVDRGARERAGVAPSYVEGGRVRGKGLRIGAFRPAAAMLALAGCGGE